MADTLESLELEVKHSATGAADSVYEVTEAIRQMGKVLGSVLPQMQNYVSTLRNMARVSVGKSWGVQQQNALESADPGFKGSLSGALDTNEINEVGEAFEKVKETVGGVADKIKDAVSAQTELAEETKTASQLISQEMQEYISSASKTDLLKEKLSDLNYELDKAFESGNIDKAFNIRSQIIRTEEALDKANKTAESTQGSMSRASSGVKALSKEAGKAQTPLKNFISSLKRIAFYRIIRSIIKSITEALSEGLQNAYAFSQGIDGESHRFAIAMDSMKSAGTKMKNQLGSAFIALLTAIQPIVDAIIALVTRLANAISQLFAAFTGRRYLKAMDVSDQFADTMKAGAGAAKEWKNQILGFDEINKLNEPSSGGGGAAALDPMDMFEDSPINQKILDFVNTLKDKLQPAVERLKEAFQRLKDAWDAFVASFDGSKLKQLTTDLLALGGEAVINGLTVLTDVLTLVLNVLNALNTGDWSKVWVSFKWLIYDVAVAIEDLIHSLTLLFMDALIIVAGVIDDLIGTDLAGWLQEDRDKFDEMYKSSRDSEEGLLGLKKALGLTEDSTENLAEESEKLTGKLEEVGTQSDILDGKVRGVRKASDWVLEGFRDFGVEVETIITSLFRPLEDLSLWVEKVLDKFNLLDGINIRTNRMWDDGSVYLQGFASGGYPAQGSLFVANEAGPEMVGTIGGNTAVATNNDIVQAIEGGVFRAMTSAVGSGRGNNGEVVLNINGREFMRAVYSDFRAVANERGVSLVVGG